MYADLDTRNALGEPASTSGERCRTVAGLLQSVELCTPAFVYDEASLAAAAHHVAALAHAAGCKASYAIKACSASPVLATVAPRLDSLATSSLYEARLAREVAGADVPLHLTTPGLREQEVAELARLCERVSVNSLPQLERFRAVFAREDQLGLRVNPQMSFIDDPRYDPCRAHSKLGVPLDELCERLGRDARLFEGISGLHLHSNCDSNDLGALAATVARLVERLGPWLGGLRWVNLGGGYLFESVDDAARLASALRPLREQHGLEVVIEPGAAIVRAAGYLVASVVDVFQSEGREIAVLDTSVNHMPEVFEYDYEPDVIGDDVQAPHEYTLVGATCLAGDQFGLYGFREPLAPGRRLVFPDLGAYAQVKAHVFNGVALPTVYLLAADGTLSEQGRFEFDDYRRLMAGGPRATA